MFTRYNSVFSRPGSFSLPIFFVYLNCVMLLEFHLMFFLSIFSEDICDWSIASAHFRREYTGNLSEDFQDQLNEKIKGSCCGISGTYTSSAGS